MKITILKLDQWKDIDLNVIKSLESYNQNKEILGQLTTDNETITIDPHKISHVIKNIRYSEITMTLDCDIECLSTPYGEQLKILLDKHREKVKFVPIYSHDDTQPTIKDLKLYTVNAVLRKDIK